MANLESPQNPSNQSSQTNGSQSQPEPENGQFTDRFEAEAARIPDEILEPGIESPKGAPAQAAEPGWPTAMVAGLFSFPTNYLALRAGDYWKLSQIELDMLVLTWKPLLDELIPFDTLGKYGAAIAALTMVFGPRLVQFQAEKQKTQNTQTATAAA